MVATPSFRDLSSLLQRFDERLMDSETGVRAGNTAITEGRLTVRDETGQEWIRLGALAQGGPYGLEVRAADGTWSRVDIAATGRRLGVSTSSSLITAASGWSSTVGPEVTVETSTGQIQLSSLVTLSEIGYDACVVSTEIRNEMNTVVVGPSNAAGNGTTVAPALLPTGFPYSVAGFWTLPPGIYKVRHRFNPGPTPYTARADAVVMTVTPS